MDLSELTVKMDTEKSAECLETVGSSVAMLFLKEVLETC